MAKQRVVVVERAEAVEDEKSDGKTLIRQFPKQTPMTALGPFTLLALIPFHCDSTCVIRASAADTAVELP